MVRLTLDMQSQTQTRHVSSERDLEAFCGQERVEDVTHDVDLVFLASLELLPDDRIVKHIELERIELTEHLQWLALVNDEHLVFWCHSHRITCSSSNSPVQLVNSTDKQRAGYFT